MGVVVREEFAAIMRDVDARQAGETVRVGVPTSIAKLDGHIGDKTLAVFNLVRREEFLENFRAFVLQRIENVIRIDSKNERFRKGWENRADRLLTLRTHPPLNREIP